MAVTDPGGTSTRRGCRIVFLAPFPAIPATPQNLRSATSHFATRARPSDKISFPVSRDARPTIRDMRRFVRTVPRLRAPPEWVEGAWLSKKSINKLGSFTL